MEEAKLSEIIEWLRGIDALLRDIKVTIEKSTQDITDAIAVWGPSED